MYSLNGLQRFQQKPRYWRKTLPVARRILGKSNEITLRMVGTMRMHSAVTPGATLDDLREAVMTLEDAAQVVRRVLGGANPLTEGD